MLAQCGLPARQRSTARSQHAADEAADILGR